MQQAPHDKGDAGDDQRAGHVAQRGVLQERAVDHVRQGHRLHDDRHRADAGDEEGDAGHPPQTRHPRREVGIDQAGPTRPSGSRVHSRNVVSFTLTARPTRPSATARRAVSASSQVAAVRTPSARSATTAVRTGSRPSTPP